MVDVNTKLTILHDDNSLFTDYSSEAVDFSRDTFTVALNTNEDYLYIGFKKPINCLYFHFDTANTVANKLNIQYYNNTWVSVQNAQDNTNGLKRNGFITWTRPTDAKNNAINSQDMYWVRIKPDTTHSSTVFTGINILFSDDNDLRMEVPEILDTAHLSGKTSHVLTHVAVRNQILQALKQKDYKTYNYTTGVNEDITAWDLFDVNQLNQAAVNLALHKIYFNFSDEKDDKWESKSKHFYGRYEANMNNVRLSLDKNNDGVEQDYEMLNELKSVRITR